MYDPLGVDMFGDVDAPHVAVRSLNHVDDITSGLEHPPPGVKAWGPLYESYGTAGWEAWRARAIAQLTLDATHADGWNAGNITTEALRSTAAVLRDDLLQLVAHVAIEQGSPLGPREFLKRKGQSPVDVIMSGLVDGLDRLASFERAHWVAAWGH